MGSNNPDNNAIAGAIEYPANSNERAERAANQPRQPRNLQGLLRFAMEATKAEDAPGNSQLGPMDEERRRFLEEALRGLTVDVAQLLRNSIKTLADAERIRSIQLGQPLPEDVTTAFHNLLEFIDDIDTANDFYKIGGYAIFPICYGSENDEIRAKASSVLAELCQNNPYCQARALECGLLSVLLNLVQVERGEALSKCLYAISCCTREYKPAVRELTTAGGCEALAVHVSATEPAARSKAAFLVRYLAHNYNEAKDRFIEQNVVKTIAVQLKAGRDETSEHLLNCLLALVEGLDPRVLEQCRDPSLDLKKVLENHLNHPDLQSDRFLEEKEYCFEVLTMLFEDFQPVDPVNEEVADR